MKIIVVNDYGRIVGGAAKIAIMTARAFAERGHDVEFFAGNKGIGLELESMPKIRITSLDEGPHTRDPNRLRGAIRGLYYRRAAGKMREILSRCDPKDTVLHFHAYRETLTTSVADAAIKMGFATVYTAHEYTLGCPYGGFFDYRRNCICPERGLSMGCLRRECNLSGTGNRLWYFAMEFVFSKICRIPKRLSHVVFISTLNRRVLEPYLRGRTRCSIVSNAYDFFDAAPAKIEEGSPFLFIGALEPHKDPLTAARAARDLGAPITFVGSGSLEEAIKNEYPQAEITGWVGREEVQRQIQRSRALIFPSIWYEAQPGTTMEAAANGLAIIVADLSAAVEQVEQLGVGEVYRGGDVADLAEKMRPYLDVGHARSQGTATQRAYRKLDLSMDRHISALLEIYQSELKGRGR